MRNGEAGLLIFRHFVLLLTEVVCFLCNSLCFSFFFIRIKPTKINHSVSSSRLVCTPKTGIVCYLRRDWRTSRAMPQMKSRANSAAAMATSGCRRPRRLSHSGQGRMTSWSTGMVSGCTVTSARRLSPSTSSWSVISRFWNRTVSPDGSHAHGTESVRIYSGTVSVSRTWAVVWVKHSGHCRRSRSSRCWQLQPCSTRNGMMANGIIFLTDMVIVLVRLFYLFLMFFFFAGLPDTGRTLPLTMVPFRE